ncbi:MAG: hypothetical protein DCC75_12435, partial [Proteobacteria bacterium]
ESLVEAASIGVRVPEPVAWVDRGAVIYRAWLVTKEIKGHRSLAELALSASNSASLSEISKVLEELGRQVELLIQNRLLHVDLHPGNVVVDQHGQVYILDFDKARKFTGGIRELRDQYLRRWRRAVIKHNLPDSLSENMCFHLKRDTLQLQ